MLLSLLNFFGGAQASPTPAAPPSPPPLCRPWFWWSTKRGQNVASYMGYPMEYLKFRTLKSYFGHVKGFINMVRHVDVHTLIYFELSNNIQALFPVFHMFRATFCL